MEWRYIRCYCSPVGIKKTIFWISVVTHEGEGDCTIWVLLFENKGEVYVMAKGMDIKLHVAHGGEKQRDAKARREHYGN